MELRNLLRAINFSEPALQPRAPTWYWRIRAGVLLRHEGPGSYGIGFWMPQILKTASGWPC